MCAFFFLGGGGARGKVLPGGPRPSPTGAFQQLSLGDVDVAWKVVTNGQSGSKKNDTEKKLDVSEKVQKPGRCVQ